MEYSNETVRQLQRADAAAIDAAFEPVREPACRFLLVLAALEPTDDGEVWAGTLFETCAVLCLRRIRRFGLSRNFRSWFHRLLLDLALSDLRAREPASNRSRLSAALLALRLTQFGDHDALARLAGIPLDRVRAHLFAARLRQIESEHPSPTLCADERWHLLVDGEIFGREARELTAHVATCTACGPALATWRAIERRTRAAANEGWSRLAGRSPTEGIVARMTLEPDEAAEQEWIRDADRDHEREKPGRSVSTRLVWMLVLGVVGATLLAALLRR